MKYKKSHYNTGSADIKDKLYLKWVALRRHMTSKSIAWKAYLTITFLVTLPLCFAFNYFSAQQEMVIMMENEREVARISATLAQRIPHKGEPAMFWDDGFRRDEFFTQKMSKMNTFYQPYVDELTRIYPQYEIGIYHRKLDSIVAISPFVRPEALLFIDSPAVKQLYNSGEPVVSVTDLRYEGIPSLVAFSPIYHRGEVAGFTWVGKKVNNVKNESNQFFTKGIIVSFIVWLILIFVIRRVFERLDGSLLQFANQITGKKLSPVEFNDFPQLKPLFETVVNLREELKRETEQYLEESRTLKKLIELSPMAIFLIDKYGIIKECNQAFLSFYPNFNREKVINFSFKVLADASNRNFEETVIIRALHGEEIRDEYGFFLNRYWISNAFPLKNNGGEITGAIAICHDVTEYEKMQRDMARLDRLNIVGQMAASVAHEVRNPMTVVRGYAQSLAKKTGGAYSSQFDTIIIELDRANRIISDFLSLARDKYTEKKTESLVKIVYEILPLIESQALERDISCSVQLDEDLPMLLLNAEEIKQLILNLSMNALDAMHEGELIITCIYNSRTEEVELAVCDSGCGMDSIDIERVFEPFYTTKKNGSGLGLAICKSITERHGGYISIQSEKGKGSVFTVKFPINTDAIN